MATPSTYTYTFKVDPKMFRKALYFNTFGKQRIQAFVIAAMALMGVGMLISNLVFKVAMTSVMQLCYIVIIAAAPLLIFSCEHSYRDYRRSPLADAMRTVSVNQDWLKFRVTGGADSEKIEWRQVSAVFELAEFFIIYRDSNLMVLLPKSEIPEDELSQVRAIMRGNLGRGFHLRSMNAASALA